ncbi:MAG: leucine-rich repeat domain-containing protein [Clostridia bacterium]|nr:leucine-rich repeat domain-containing protein [Clostridia bacterium]
MQRRIKGMFLVLLSACVLMALPAAAESGGFTLPEDLRVIEAEAFTGLNAESVTLPEGIEVIDSRAFAESRITSIALPDSLSFIADDAFESSALAHVSAAKGTYAYDWAVAMGYIEEIHETPASDFEYTIANGECTINQYIGTEETVYIPSQIEGAPVTSIGAFAFLFCDCPPYIMIPDSVTSIGVLALTGSGINVDINNNSFSSLDGVLFDKNQYTLIQYPPLKEDIHYSIPDSVTSIGNGAFAFCRLTSIAIPDTVTRIETGAFGACIGLTSITFPDSVTSIGEQAFWNCKNLTSITIPDTVTSIGDKAFWYCENLTSITIPDAITSIGDEVFCGCGSLTSITIPDTVTSIGYNAFANCSSLTSINIPDTVTSIGDSAFFGCSSLTNINIPDTVTCIGEFAFYNCSSLTSIIIPDTVTSIGYYVFYGCSSLTNINIPDTVTYIGEFAFYNCSSLTSIIIPDSVASIGFHAFYSCSSLTSVIFLGPDTDFEIWAFSGCSPDMVIYGISGSNIEYQIRGEGYRFMPLGSGTIGGGSLSVSTPGRVYLGVGQHYIPNFNFTGGTVYDYTCTFDSRDTRVAVDAGDGAIRAVGTGSTYVTAQVRFFDQTGADRGSATVAFEVRVNLFLDPASIILEPGESAEVNPVYRAASDPDGQEQNTAIHYSREAWSSSDSSVVTVDENGAVRAIAPSSALIICEVTVTDETLASPPQTMRVVCVVTVVADIDDASRQELFYHELRGIPLGDNPLDDPVIYKIMYDELVLTDGGNDAEAFAREVLRYVKNAPSTYRDIYVYSFFDYKKMTDTGIRIPKYDSSSNTLTTKPFDASCDKDTKIKQIATWFHEAGHAVDSLSVSGGANLTDSYEYLLRPALLQDARSFLNTYMEEYQSEKGVSFSTNEIEAIFTAIFDPRNKDTDVETTRYDEEGTPRQGIANPPVGISAEYRDDYISFVEDTTYKIIMWSVSKLRDYSPYIHDNSMVCDLLSGTTNNVICGSEGHGKSFGGNAYYWYGPLGGWKNSQAHEAWAEFFSSQMMQLAENVSANERYCYNTCLIFEEFLEPQIYDHFTGKVR